MDKVIYVIIATDIDGHDIPLKAFTTRKKAEKDSKLIAKNTTHWYRTSIVCIELDEEGLE